MVLTVTEYRSVFISTRVLRKEIAPQLRLAYAMVHDSTLGVAAPIAAPSTIKGIVGVRRPQ